MREPAAWAAAAREAKLAIVDLRLPTALAALEALAAVPAGGVRTVGFVEHERTDVMDAARAKGCSDVMAKGQFANALPKLLAGDSRRAAAALVAERRRKQRQELAQRADDQVGRAPVGELVGGQRAGVDEGGAAAGAASGHARRTCSRRRSGCRRGLDAERRRTARARPPATACGGPSSRV